MEALNNREDNSSLLFFCIIMGKSRSNNILVDFNMIFDTDLGILKFLMNKYPKSKFFIEGRSEATEYFLKYLLYTRSYRNPLIVLIKDKYDIDDLYNQIFNEKWEEVLKYTKPTSIYYFLSEFGVSNGYNITVNCKNTLEQIRCEKERNNPWNYKIDVSDIKKYFCIYQENSEDLQKYKNISGKSIYLCDYGPNYIKDENGDNIPNIIAELLSKTNEVKYINKYARFELPK